MCFGFYKRLHGVTTLLYPHNVIIGIYTETKRLKNILKIQQATLLHDLITFLFGKNFSFSLILLALVDFHKGFIAWTLTCQKSGISKLYENLYSEAEKQRVDQSRAVIEDNSDIIIITT